MVESSFAATAPGNELRAALRHCVGALVGVGIFSGVVNILGLTGSLYMLQIYDRVLPSQSVPTLVGITIIMVWLYAVYGLLDFVRLRLLVRIGNTLDRKLHEKAFAASLLLPLRAGHEGARVQPIRDVDQIRSFVSGTGPTAFFDLPWIPFYMVIIYMLHPSLGLLATCGAVVIVLLTLVAGASRTRPVEAGDRIGDLAHLLCRGRPPQRRSHPRHGPLQPVRQAVERAEPALSRRAAAGLRCRRRHRRAVADAAHGAAVADARAWRLSGDVRRGLVRRHHRLLHHVRPRAGSRRHRDRQLAQLQFGPPELCAACQDAEGGCRPQAADGAAAAPPHALGRDAGSRRTRTAEAAHPERQLRARSGRRAGRDRAERVRQVDAGARHRRRLAGAARLCAPRPGGARPMGRRGARARHRLSAAGHRTVRRHGCRKHLPLRQGRRCQ